MLLIDMLSVKTTVLVCVV